MKRISLVTLAILGLGAGTVLVSSYPHASAHCQVPCGIYDDPARIEALLEDTATIAKAIAQISELTSRSSAQDLNQAVRWINTKEEHAAHIIETVALYFLTQKVKEVPADGGEYQAYLQKLADHHAVMRAAMKTKQTVDPAAAKALKDAVEKLTKYYHSH